jgi:uncharacterized protein (DUF488 family)
VIYTIGHSTRPLDEFLSLLRTHQIGRLADVRTVPRSRRHPHFAGTALAASLATVGIEYRHYGALGGLRKPRADSTNTGWRNESFRGYADYMQTAAFAQGLNELLDWQRESDVYASARSNQTANEDPEPRIVIMCAESVWWRCHRQLIADALVARAVDVAHIMSASAATLHTLTAFARLSDGRVSYPGLV